MEAGQSVQLCVHGKSPNGTSPSHNPTMEITALRGPTHGRCRGGYLKGHYSKHGSEHNRSVKGTIHLRAQADTRYLLP